MAKIEIERKFIYKPSLFASFIRGLGDSPFTDLTIKGERKIHDIYYDASVASTIDGNTDARGSAPGILERNGIWIRRRNERWEAKQRLVLPQQKQQEDATEKQRDYYLRTAFEELTCPLAIHNLVRSYIPSAPGADGHFGLRPIADFSTKRVLAVADGRFEIALDHASFGHFVGEVELLADKGKEAQAQKDIDEFMEMHRWFFFPDETEGADMKGRKKKYMLQGKLSAYFEKYPVKF